MVMPTLRTPDLEQNILARLSQGEPLAVICRDEGMPHPSTWRDWCDTDQTLAIAYARAREDGFDAIAIEALDIADETKHDTKLVGRDGEEHEVANNEWISRSKLRVETRLKLLAKWDPKRYGDAMLHKVADADGEKLPMDETATMTRLASIVAALKGQSGEPAD